ncbi:MAG TPA: hypothetical protein VL461_10910 [Dictyobacter sp.]|jgi:hypothetical protein|nr:hypothetical protein [Dictyobacter sp.]
MSEILLRLAILLLVGVFTVVLIVAGRRLVNERRQHKLKDEHVVIPDASKIENSQVDPAIPVLMKTPVRILAFTSDDCVQYRQLQAPVLRRVVEAKGEDVVSVITIDVPSAPELTARYHVLTLPTTVLLDVYGKAHAVNYGFTNAQSLIKQVDEILSVNGAQEALS